MAAPHRHADTLLACFAMLGVAGILGVLIGKTTALPELLQAALWVCAGLLGGLLARRVLPELERNQLVVSSILIAAIVIGARVQNGTPFVLALPTGGAIVGGIAAAFIRGSKAAGPVLRVLAAGAATFGGIVLAVGLLKPTGIIFTVVFAAGIAAAMLAALRLADVQGWQVALGAALVCCFIGLRGGLETAAGTLLFGAFIGAVGGGIGAAIRRRRDARIEVPEARRVS